MRHAFACAVSAAVLLAAGTAAAQDVDVSFNAALTSDYVFRGFSQTSSDPALQGGVDATIGSFYVGGWASTIDFGDDTDAEIDLYGGYRTEAAGFALDFGVVGYFYEGDASGSDYDYVEFKAAASRAIGPVTAGVAVYYSDDFFGIDEEATYAELNASFAPADKWTLSAAVGEQWLDVNSDYTTWNLGAGYAFTDYLALDVRYHDTEIDSPISDDRVVATLKLLY